MYFIANTTLLLVGITNRFVKYSNTTISEYLIHIPNIFFLQYISSFPNYQ